MALQQLCCGLTDCLKKLTSKKVSNYKLLIDCFSLLHCIVVVMCKGLQIRIGCFCFVLQSQCSSTPFAVTA